MVSLIIGFYKLIIIYKKIHVCITIYSTNIQIIHYLPSKSLPPKSRTLNIIIRFHRIAFTTILSCICW